MIPHEWLHDRRGKHVLGGTNQLSKHYCYVPHTTALVAHLYELAPTPRLNLLLMVLWEPPHLYHGPSHCSPGTTIVHLKYVC